jgi:predicted O-methyltransferase YrrM
MTRMTNNLHELLHAPLEAEWLCARDQLDHHFGETPATVNPGDRRALYYLVRGFRAARVLEVGTHVGASTANIARALADTYAATSGTTPRLITVDIQNVNDPQRGPWRQFELQSSPHEVLQSMNCAHFVSFVTEHSLTYLGRATEQFDLIFLDGDHEAHTVRQEIAACLPLLAPGGVMLLHDYFPDGQPLWNNCVVIPGPWEAVRDIQAQGVPVSAVPLGSLPWPTKLGSNVTSLALLRATI